jgi:hypothetical protein
VSLSLGRSRLRGDDLEKPCLFEKADGRQFLLNTLDTRLLLDPLSHATGNLCVAALKCRTGRQCL